MANTKLATPKTNELSLAGATQLVDSIKLGLATISKGYLAITPDVAKLYDCKGFKALGYKNFDEMCTFEFGMSHGTSVGIRKVFDKFGAITKENKYVIPEKYLEFGYTKLLTFAQDWKKFEDVGINPTTDFTPDMTIREMRDALQLKLEEKAGKQEAEAIDTTAKDVSRETSNASETTEAAEASKVTPLDERMELINEISRCAKLLHDMCDEVKPDKLALLDGISANILEFEKVVKKIYK